MDNETISLMDKNVNDLTVADALKINFAVIAATAAIGAVFIGSAVTYEKFTTWNMNRKIKKFNENPLVEV